MSSMHTIRFPGESEQYRRARDELLLAELDLRRKIEEVAVLRRQLPLGGVVPQDYVFEEGAPDLDDRDSVRAVRLSQLFEADKDSLILYSFMYGPDMADPCPMCTSLLDGLNGTAVNAAQRLNLAVVAKSPIERIREFARKRGWRHLRLLSSAQNTFNGDFHGESPDGAQSPSINVFVRRKGRVRHFYAAEGLYVSSEPGQDSRHADLLWPLWNLLDLTPDGRGADWYPSLAYD